MARTRSSAATSRRPRSQEAPQAQHHSVSEGYLETMGATLLDGRLFTAQDTATTEAVVVLNETAAKRYFPGESAVGREMLSWSSQIGPLGRNLTWQVGADGHRTQPRLRVVGVIADIQNVALGMPVEPAVYFPTRQFPFSAVTIAISAHDPATALSAMRTALQAVSPHTPLGTVETWRDRFNTRTAEPRLLMTTLTAFGALAGFLAALGVYGCSRGPSPCASANSPFASRSGRGRTRWQPPSCARASCWWRSASPAGGCSCSRLRGAGHCPLRGHTERRGIDWGGGAAVVRGSAHRQPASRVARDARRSG